MSWDFKVLSVNIPKNCNINTNIVAKQLFNSLKSLLLMSNNLENQSRVFEFLETFYKVQNSSLQESLDKSSNFKLSLNRKKTVQHLLK